MELNDLLVLIPDLPSWTHVRKIRLFAWHLHTHRNVADFQPLQLRSCYEALHFELPSNFTALLSSLGDKKPREVLKSNRGYKLERRVRDELDAQYGQRPTAIAVDKLLRDLPAQLGNLKERAYLDEALLCFRVGAYRGAVVMCWNLAFDHLCEYVLQHHLAAFNAQLPRSFPKADISVIAKREDFAVLKESQVLQVCSSANITSGSLHKVLKEKLDRRNVAAHPSGIITTQLTAEEFIKDLIDNVVLKLV